MKEPNVFRLTPEWMLEQFKKNKTSKTDFFMHSNNPKPIGIFRLVSTDDGYGEPFLQIFKIKYIENLFQYDSALVTLKDFTLHFSRYSYVLCSNVMVEFPGNIENKSLEFEEKTKRQIGYQNEILTTEDPFGQCGWLPKLKIELSKEQDLKNEHVNFRKWLGV